MNEEDIKILEGIIELYKISNEMPYKFNKHIIQAIENLINRNKELEEENKNYKKYSVMMSTEGLIINGVKFSFNDYIPKSKVKEKINEVKDLLERKTARGSGKSTIELVNYTKALGKLEVLEELLEE